MKKMNNESDWRRIIVTAAMMVLSPVPGLAQNVALDPGMSIDEKRTGWLPYVFSSESLDTAIGAGAFSSGTIQPQASLFGTGFVTLNESALVSGSFTNYRFGDSRFFLDTFVLADRFTDQRYYGDYDRDPRQERAGSNGSDKDDYVTGTSNQATLELTLKYRLPIGGIKDNPVSVYHLKRGMLESGPAGGETWNPLTSGQTTAAAKFPLVPTVRRGNEKTARNRSAAAPPSLCPLPEGV
jgi:hypothetical protein